MTDGEWMGKLLKSFMRRRNITQVELAARCDLSKETIYTITKKGHAPNFITLKKLHEGTGLPYDAFFREGDFAPWR